MNHFELARFANIFYLCNWISDELCHILAEHLLIFAPKLKVILKSNAYVKRYNNICLQ